MNLSRGIVRHIFPSFAHICPSFALDLPSFANIFQSFVPFILSYLASFVPLQCRTKLVPLFDLVIYPLESLISKLKLVQGRG